MTDVATLDELEAQHGVDRIIPCRVRYLHNKVTCLRPSRWMVQFRCPACGTVARPSCDLHAARGDTRSLAMWWATTNMFCITDGERIDFLSVWKL